jgi:type II secretory pathway predicted ATPase ExeA
VTSPLLADDPFGVTADPAGYMAREASERALAALERAVADGVGITVLCGPPGIGKTLLLRVLEKRLGGRLRPVYLPYAALRFEELCAWVLGLLGEAPQAGASPPEALRALAERSASAERPLLLLVDDAHAMPKEAAERLGQFVVETGRALRVIVAGPDDAPAMGRDEPEAAPAWSTAFGPELVRVAFDQPMSATETALFVRGRLERAALDPAARERFDAAVVGRLHRRSGGVPRVVQSLAGEVLRRGESALPRDSLQDLLAEDARSGAAVQARSRAAQPADPTRSGDAAAPPRDAAQAAALLPPSPAEGSTILPAAVVPGAKETPPAVPSRPAPAPPRPEAVPPRPPAREPAPAPRPMEARSPRAETPRPSSAAPLRRPEPTLLEAPPRALRIFLVVLGLGAILLALPLLRGLLAPPTPPRDTLPAPATVRPERRPAPAEREQPIAREPEPEPLGAPVEQRIETLPMAPEPEPVAEARPVAPPAPEREPIAEARPVAPREPDPVAEPRPVAPSEPLPPAAVAPTVDLKPVPVHVNATPWATIAVDGVDLGETPIAGVPLVPGTHRFTARMPDGRVVERTVEIDAKRRHVSFE